MSITLQLGDIIEIIAPKDDLLNDNTFLINYIDNETIELINSVTFEPINLEINPISHQFENQAIEQINLISRAASPSFAKQNGLLPGTWVNITFDAGDYPVVLTAEITNLDEDMIELRTYPDKETLYINFAYHGIPRDLNISSIEIRSPPAPAVVPVTEETAPAPIEPDLEMEPVEHLYEKNRPINVPLKTGRVFLDSNNFKISSEELGPIVQYVNVGSQYQRYSLEAQLTDILDDILSGIPTYDRTSRIMNEIHILLERYKQLREAYSIFDDNQNVIGPAYKTATHKPLLDWFNKFDIKLHWLVPVVKNRKKLYLIDDKERNKWLNEEDDREQTNDSMIVIDFENDLEDIQEIIQKYRANSATFNNQNKLSQCYSDLAPYMQPYENPVKGASASAASGPYLSIEKQINTNQLYSIMNNKANDQFISNVYNKGTIASSPTGLGSTMSFASQTLISGMTKLVSKYVTQGSHKQITETVPMTPNESMTILSFITFPISVIKYSAINLPKTRLYDRSNLCKVSFDYDLLFDSSSREVNNVEISTYYKSPAAIYNASQAEISRERAKNNAFVFECGEGAPQAPNTKQCALNNFVAEEELFRANNRAGNSNKQYENYIENMVPRTKALFHLMREHLTYKRGISFSNVVEQLEPFLIYNDSITYSQYEDIVRYLQYTINQYNKGFINNIKSLLLIKKYKNPVAIPKTIVYPLFGLFDSQEVREDVVATYGLESCIVLHDSSKSDYVCTNNEVMLAIRKEDCGRYFNNLVSLQNLRLMTPDNLVQLFEGLGTGTTKKVGQVDEAGNTDKQCGPIQIAKSYSSDAELQQDNNNPNVYWDAKFDKTNYGLMEEKKIADAVTSMPSNEFTVFLINLLRTDYKLDDSAAAYSAETLINGRKRVIDGQYAILTYSTNNDSFEYFIRKSNVWIKTDEPPINGINAVDDNSLCNIRAQCMAAMSQHVSDSKDNKNSILVDNCNTIETTKTDLKKQLIKRILNEFDDHFVASVEHLRKKLEYEIIYNKQLVPILRRLDLTYKFQFNIQKIALTKATNKQREGEGEGDDSAQPGLGEPIKSPYEPIRDLILSQKDFVKKQYDIIKFANTCTRSAYSHSEIGPLGTKETEHWLYCLKTNVPLLPTFLYSLATIYIENPDLYGVQMEMIIAQIGKMSDDGNMIVDKYSGYPIKMIEYSTMEGYDDSGYKIVSHGVVEKDANIAASTTSTNTIDRDSVDELIDRIEGTTSNQPQPTVQQALTAIKASDSVPVKIIKIVVNYLAMSMGIAMEQQIEFIIRTVIPLFEENLPNETEYNRAMKQLANMGKKTVSYEEIYNKLLLYITLATYFVALQTAIPQIVTRKTFPNCVRSFSGYPFDGEGDISGINYLACILVKIKNTSSPWNVLLKKTEGSVAQTIKEHIEKYLIGLSEVRFRMDEKAKYLEYHVDPEQQIFEVYNVNNKWAAFLPPLKQFKLHPTPVPLTSAFRESLVNDLKTGSSTRSNATNKILVVKSKIIQYGLAIIETIQSVINGQQIILHKMNNEPYLENACCNNEPKRVDDPYAKVQTAVGFFVEKKPEIVQYNKLVREYSAIIADIDAYTKASQLWCPLNDKIIYSALPTQFSEKTVYNAYITYCNLRNLQPIPSELVTFCKSKPANIMPTDTLNEIIIKLKADGRNYSYDSLLRFLQVIQFNKIIDIPTPLNMHNSPSNNLRIALPSLEEAILNVESYLTANSGLLATKKRLLDLLRSVLSADNAATATTTKELNNFLLNQIPIMQTQIINFMTQNRQNVVKNIDATSLKHVANFFNSFTEWNNDDQSATATLDGIGGNTANKFDFYAESIRAMVFVIPQMVQNRVNRMDDAIPKHWDLAPSHQRDLQEIIRKHYSLVNTLMSKDLRLGRLLSLIGDVGRATAFLSEKVKNIFVGTRTCLYLMQFFVYQVMVDYIALSERPDNIISVRTQRDMEVANTTLTNVDYVNDQTTQRDFIENDEVQNEMVYQGDRKTLRGNVAYCLLVYIEMMIRQKELINVSNKDIKEIVYKSQEREKDMMTHRLEVMTDEARAVDKIFQKNKLGDIWGKGLQKGFLTYSREEYENPKDRQFVEEMQRFERAQKDRGLDESFEEYMERRISDRQIDDDAYEIEMPEDGEGNEDGDYNNVDYEDYTMDY